jgi:hypothetical protein
MVAGVPEVADTSGQENIAEELRLHEKEVTPVELCSRHHFIFHMTRTP